MQTSNATAKFMRLITLLVCFKKIITLFYSNFLIFSPLIYFLWPSFSTLIYFCILVLPLYCQFPIKGGFILIDEGRNTTCMLARHHFDGSLQVEDDLSFFLDCFHWLLSHWIELANVHKHITRWGTSSSFFTHLSMVRSKLSYQLIAHALDQMLGSLAHDQAIYIAIAPKPTWRCQQGSWRARKLSWRRCRRWTHHESWSWSIANSPAWVDIHHHHACALHSAVDHPVARARTRSWQGSWKPPSSLSTSTSVRVFVLFEDKDTLWHLSNYGIARPRDLMGRMMFLRGRVDLDKQPHGRC
jgi:hypothetical protein